MQLGHQLCVVVIFFTSRKKKLRTFFAVRTFLSRLARSERLSFCSTSSFDGRTGEATSGQPMPII